MKLRGKVVVVTGASSGIGRATALHLAKRGADLVLAARRGEALDEVAAECRELGVRAIAVPTDITVHEQCERLARVAVAEFGRVDAWVNNAGVYAGGKAESLPRDVFERVMAVNYMGSVDCTRAILPQMRAQGAGVIVMVDSLAGKIGEPSTSAYSASKFALRGFSEALRVEVSDASIEVCTVYPPSIDTPLFSHSANFTGREGRPLSGPYPAERVAKVIAGLIARPRREVVIGSGRRLTLFHALAPELATRAVRIRAKFKQSRKPAPPSRGNLYRPSEGDARISGGWRRRAIVKRIAALAALGVIAGFAARQLPA